MKYVALLFALFIVNHSGGAMDTTSVTLENYWKIADYADKSELIGDSSVHEIKPDDGEVNLSVKFPGIAKKVLHGNSLIVISNLRSKVSFSITFNTSDGKAAINQKGSAGDLRPRKSLLGSVRSIRGTICQLYLRKSTIFVMFITKTGHF
jgi:hypothetical protein